MTTNITERRTTAADPWAKTLIPGVPDAYGVAVHSYRFPDVIDVTASDYDEGGNNSVTISVPLHRGKTPAAEVEKSLSFAVDTAREHLLNYLTAQRKKETTGDKIIRFLRREWRYLLRMAKPA